MTPTLNDMKMSPLSPKFAEIEKRLLEEIRMRDEMPYDGPTGPGPHVWDRDDPPNGQLESGRPSNEADEEIVEDAPVDGKLTAENPPIGLSTVLGGPPEPETHSLRVGCHTRQELQSSDGSLWPDPGPIDLAGYGWFEELTRNLHGVGLSQPMSVLAPLLSVAAVAGPSYWIRPPVPGVVASSLNLIIQAKAGSQVRQIIDGLFLPALMKQQMAKAGVVLSPDQINNILALLIRQLCQLETTIKELELAQNWAGPVNPALTSPELVKARGERDSLNSKIAEHLFSRNPDLLVVDTSLEQLDPRRLAFDGAAHHISTSGSAWARLLAMGRKDGAGLAASLASTWRPTFKSEKLSDPYCLLVSATWLMGEAQTREFLTSRRIRDSGVADQFLVVEGATPKPGDDVYWSLGKSEIADLVERIWNERIAGKVTILDMGGDAAVAYLDYLQDRHRLALQLGDRAFQLLDRLGPLLCKLTLLLHLVRHQDPRCPIETETVRSASVLCDRLVASHITILDRCLDSGPEGDFVTGFEMIERRLSIRGPLSLRDLMRSFRGVRKDSLIPILETAQAEGRIVESDGRFALADDTNTSFPT